MEERIIDDEYGRGIRFRKTKDGYVDATDELAEEEKEFAEEKEVAEETGDGTQIEAAPDEDVTEEALVVDNLEESLEDLEEEGDGEEVTFEFPELEEDDEDLVNLTPEEAAALRRKKAEEEAQRKADYKRFCEEGEELLLAGSYKEAEDKFAAALPLEENAWEAAAGYWRAKTSDFSAPDVLMDEYLETGYESMENDLGEDALGAIKRQYKEVFEKRLKEISDEEAPLEKEVLEKFGLANEGRRYVNVRYLYEIHTGKKYPIKDRHFDSMTEDIPVRLMGGVPMIIYEAFYKNEPDESMDGGSEILTVPVDEFIAHVKADGMAGLTRVTGAGDAGFDYVRLMETENDRIIFRRRKIKEGHEELVQLTFSGDDGYVPEILKAYDIPQGGNIFYDLTEKKVYWFPEEEAQDKKVLCLTEPSQVAAYDGKYGNFAGLFGDEWMITTYYDEVFMKEYEYHEYVAIHNLKNGHVETVAGRFERTPGALVLLRSFLAL